MIDHDAFILVVADDAGIGVDEAERAAHAVLQTLGERIDRGEARDIAAQLPPELSAWIATDRPEAQGFDVDEFVRRVAQREDVDADAAERQTRAVFTALGRSLDPREYDQMAAELSKDYSQLLARGPDVDVLSADEFVLRVAERTGTDDPDRARRATEAVLETLAERIAAGEVEKLIARLPRALHEPLKHGEAHDGGNAVRMGVDDFVRHVAEREHAPLVQARNDARAVLETLREAVGDEEFVDVTVQLPDEYDALLLR